MLQSAHFSLKQDFYPLTSEGRARVLILDDSTYSRNRSKSVELLSRVHDHSANRYLKGFRMLTSGWSDGGTFLPLAFSLLSSDKEKNPYQGLSVREEKDPKTLSELFYLCCDEIEDIRFAEAVFVDNLKHVSK